jgi:hypothetical protein
MSRVGVTVTYGVLTASLVLAGCLALVPQAGAQNARAKPPAKPKPSTEAPPKASAGDQWQLNLKSEPPGATAKAASGPSSCKTPCQLTLPMADTSVTFTLPGYFPQVIPIKWLPAMFHYEMYERTDQGIAVYPTDFSPNPAIEQLQPNGHAAAAKPASKKKEAAPPAEAAPPQ